MPLGRRPALVAATAGVVGLAMPALLWAVSPLRAVVLSVAVGVVVAARHAVRWRLQRRTAVLEPAG